MTEEGHVPRIRPRPAADITLRVPVDTLASLEKIAASRDMSIEALIKLYVGHGLRQDLAQSFADHVLENTARVLTRHLQSEDVSSILQEIRQETEQTLDRS